MLKMTFWISNVDSRSENDSYGLEKDKKYDLRSLTVKLMSTVGVFEMNVSQKGLNFQLKRLSQHIK